MPETSPVRAPRGLPVPALDRLSRLQRRAVLLVAGNYYSHDAVTPSRLVPAATRRALETRGLIWQSQYGSAIGPTTDLLQIMIDYAWEYLTDDRVDQVRDRATEYELAQTIALEITVDGATVFTDVRHWAAVLDTPKGIVGPLLTVLPATWWRGCDPFCERCGNGPDITPDGLGPVLEYPTGPAHDKCHAHLPGEQAPGRPARAEQP